ncbi:MAG: hypothetical protein CVT47_00985 [Thermoplasmata archaeon HGW-Thermoplasmata-2]|nr:MAG: hypothetical protein CVT47_00985 [Thermoplasmata archaeon HGW-Thermoplasmata-2]
MESRGTLLLVVSSLIFSSTPVFTRIAILDGIDPLWIVFLRSAIASVILGAAYFVGRKRKSELGNRNSGIANREPGLGNRQSGIRDVTHESRIPNTEIRIPKTEARKNLAIAAAAFTVNLLIYSFALKSATASAVSVLSHLSPIFALVFAYLAMADTISRNRILGALLSSLGAVFLVLDPCKSGDFRGYFLAIGSAAVWSLFVVYSSKAMKDYGVGFVIFFMMAICAAASLPLALSVPLVASQKGLGYIIVLGVLNTGIVYAIYNSGIKKAGPVVATIFMTISPAFTVALDFLFSRIVPTATFAIGAALVLSGILICGRIPAANALAARRTD